nr:MAG TPA: hypothetical protein [Caudoviricetes sp.]
MLRRILRGHSCGSALFVCAGRRRRREAYTEADALCR